MSEAASPVAFHTGVLNPVDHALRLVRKALSLGSRVLVVGAERPIAQLDEQLWVADPGSFTPHVRWVQESEHAARTRLAPVWLLAAAQPNSGDSPADWPNGLPVRDVLINLGLSLASAAARYPKVIEVVAADPEAKALGQARWRAWRALGVQPAHHAFS